MTPALNTADEVRAYALAGYCLCARCDAIRRAELDAPALLLASLPASVVSGIIRRDPYTLATVRAADVAAVLEALAR